MMTFMRVELSDSVTKSREAEFNSKPTNFLLSDPSVNSISPFRNRYVFIYLLISVERYVTTNIPSRNGCFLCISFFSH